MAEYIRDPVGLPEPQPLLDPVEKVSVRIVVQPDQWNTTCLTAIQMGQASSAKNFCGGPPATIHLQQGFYQVYEIAAELLRRQRPMFAGAYLE